MKYILKKGKTEILVPEGVGGGLTGETHLIVYDKKKYVLRKTISVSKAKYYEHLSKKFKKYKFLPNFLGRIGKNVFYEYIEGRDLKNEKEKLENIKSVGKILGTINKFKFEFKFDHIFRTQLRELSSGKYKPSLKVQIARKRGKIRKKPKRIFDKKQSNKILNYFNIFKKELNPKIVYECTDPTPSNFRLRNNKVYLVDIESIKPRYKGFGVSKFLMSWGKVKNRKNKFIEGYKMKNSMKFLNDKYKDFIDLIYLIQKINFQVQVGRDHKPSLKKLNSLLEKIG